MDKEKKVKRTQVNNPLHGVKLVDILELLVEDYGWKLLATKININCFKKDPSIKSSLKFLRRTEWARKQVEDLYLDLIKKKSEFEHFRK
ncbi:MAG: VF530 family protein [Saprospiraceae bacterium]|nr:VF530 family protein [Saprospiraceae bacterium]